MSATALAVSLLALVANEAQWELRLQSPSAGACTLTRHEPSAAASKSAKPIPLSKAECADARRLISESLTEVSAPSFKEEAVAPTPDEPGYRMTLGKQSFSVRFQAPEECELLASGERHCEKKALSAPQRLLLFLRAKHAP